MSDVAVIGAGAWGTALALVAHRAGNNVTLWARDADRAGHAMAMFVERHPHAARLLVVAGGVAANTAIRVALLHACTQQGFRFAAPPLKYCTDNAVMVAWTGLERLRLGLVDNMNVAPRPRWPLAELAR